MVRPGLLLSLCLLAFGPAPALASPPPAAEARAYVESSYVSAPYQVEDFTLVRSSYNPDDRLAGAGFSYRSRLHPEVTISVFVYPAGRLEPQVAVDGGMQALQADLRQAVASGIYAQLQELGREPFPLSPEAVPAKGANDIDSAVVLANAKAEQVRGEKLRLSLLQVSRNQPLHSNGYLFYKQLHFFKLRISANQSDLPREAFDVLADRATRSLIPALEVANVGSCASTTLYVDPDAAPEQGAIQLARQLTLHNGYNCHASAGKADIQARAAKASVIEIAYEADDWKSQ
ncbi:hypothetical protein [Stenotrophomonas sp. NA06056]|uniref:hypothetical protein n=1 Tax=Stenotrophomonas sp. NA06056 TaxID=2742129 RepID=UPI0020CAF63D|nr:hypothetical protein [Stenotrophomonas sp. NA06056]